MREAPSIDIIGILRDKGALFKAHDPVAMEVAKSIIGTKNIEYVAHSYDVLDGADALLLLTEWNQFRKPDYEKIKAHMKTPVVFDGRNLYDSQKMKEIGFEYYSIGRV
jgi:UDPglucose 6-dehydrogenase